MATPLKASKQPIDRLSIPSVWKLRVECSLTDTDEVFEPISFTIYKSIAVVLMESYKDSRKGDDFLLPKITRRSYKMRPDNIRPRFRCIAGVLGLTLILLTCTWAASTEQVIYNFSGGSDGGSPYAGLLLDAKGNLYSTTSVGGAYGYGTFFKLIAANGGWNESVLYAFGSITNDGAYPNSIVLDKAGNAYGMTYAGGAYGHGTVFKLNHSKGTWTETVLYSFTGGKDGGSPLQGVIRDGSGNLYGTTVNGGTDTASCQGGCGVAFKLSPHAGTWTEKVLCNFGAQGPGENPQSNLVFDKLGNLFGTAYNGGANGRGTVFELKPKSGGGWTASIVYNFGAGNDAANPAAGFIFDKAGNLYSTTYEGGPANQGTVYKLTHTKKGWKESLLYSFTGGNDGAGEAAPLIWDSEGNLYSTSDWGGANGVGTVFKLGPAKRAWKFTLLHTFAGGTSDGGNPVAPLIFDAKGNLYGTTLDYGSSGTGCGGSGCGLVFEVTP